MCRLEFFIAVLGHAKAGDLEGTNSRCTPVSIVLLFFAYSSKLLKGRRPRSQARR